MTVFAITPSAGTALTQTHAVPMVQPGAMVGGNDGHYWLYVRNASSATIPPGTAVTVNDAAKTVTPGTGNFATGVVALPAGEFGWVRRVGDGTVPPASGIGGVPIGAAGAAGTIYEGYTLSWGDDFDGPLDLLGPAVARAKYTATRSYNAGARGTDTALGVMYDTDPLHTGHNDSNRGVPVGYDNLRQQNSVVSLQARRATAAERRHFETSVDRKNVASILSLLTAAHYYPHAAGTGDIMLEFRVRWTPGASNPSGWHPTIWSLTSPPNALNLDEHDIEGNSKHAFLHRNIRTNGSIDNSQHVQGAQLLSFDGGWHTALMVINKTEVRAYIDGELMGVGEYDGNSKNQPQHILISSHIYNATFKFEQYSDAEWAADPDGATMEVDWVRIWSRTGRQHYAPLVTMPDYNIDAGGSVVIQLPSKAELWGDATVTDMVQAVRHEENEPGGRHTPESYRYLPDGVTYDDATRTLTVAPTDGKSGRLSFIVQAWRPEGTTGQPLMFSVNVGPRINWNGAIYTAGRAVGLDLYPLCDCGILVSDGTQCTKQIMVSGLAGSGLSYDPSTFMLSGTPNQGSFTLTVTCTNSIGQTASKTVTVEVEAAAPPPAYEAWAGPGWFDASDGATINLTGNTVTGMANKRSGGGDLVYGGTTDRLTRVLSAQNNKDALRLVRDISSASAIPRLRATATDPVSTLFQGSGKPFTVIAAYKPTDANTSFVWTASGAKDATDTATQLVGLVRRASSASSVRRTLAAGGGDSNFGSGQGGNTPRIVAWKFMEGATTVWDTSLTKAVDGTPHAGEAYSQFLAFALFAAHTKGISIPTFATTQGNLDFYEIIIEGEAKADADIQQAISDLAAKWGITLT